MRDGHNGATHQPLPLQVLLLALPTIVAVPPNHPLHLQALKTSVLALRCCLSLKNLAPDEECQAWLCLADLGLRVLTAGLHNQTGPQWAWVKGLEFETDTAIGKGLMLCEKHSNLHMHKIHILLLGARFSLWQRNFKVVRSHLRRAAESIYPTDPTYLHYTCQIAQIELSTRQQVPDIPQAMHHIDTLRAIAQKFGDTSIESLSAVMRLKILVDHQQWSFIPSALKEAGKLLGLECLEEPTMEAQIISPRKFPTPFESALAIHALMYGVIYLTYMGRSKETSLILAFMHANFDDGVLETFPDGSLAVPLKIGPPLLLETTHPQLLLQTAFLLSSVAKRDCVGRKPRRKIFAQASFLGDPETVKKEPKYPTWTDLHSLQLMNASLIEVMVDLMCELVAVSILRSEFELAESQLNELVAFLRSYDLFQRFAARITLHHAHLAHGLGLVARARSCYEVAAHLAGEGSWIWASAVAGNICLEIGNGGTREIPENLRTWCQSSGGSMQAVLRVLDACQTKEIVKAKQHIKVALDSATAAQDNHLRALVLALTSEMYFHTAEEHAHTMLHTCRQLAAGMGAPEEKLDGENPEVHGNAVLGLWVGRRFLDLYNRQGRTSKAIKQQDINRQFTAVLELQSKFASTLKSM